MSSLEISTKNIKQLFDKIDKENAFSFVDTPENILDTTLRSDKFIVNSRV